MNNNVDKEVNELFERSASLRNVANRGQEDPEKAINDTVAWRRRRVIRVLMLLVGIGMITYGLLSMIFRPMADNLNTLPEPSAGSMNSSEVLNTCEDALIAINEGSVTYANEGSVDIKTQEAEQIADRLLQDYLDFDSSTYPLLLGGPELVDMILPDGSTYRAWSRLWVPQLDDTDTDSASAARGVSAHVLYISAETGEPILWVKDVTLQDPLLAGCDETVVQEFTERVKSVGSDWLIGAILNISLFVIGVTILGFWQRES